MRLAAKQHRKLVLVCVNRRDDGRACCAQKDSEELYEKLKSAVKSVYPDVRVSRTYCLGNCETGATVAIMPDNIYLGEVTVEDIDAIVKQIGEVS